MTRKRKLFKMGSTQSKISYISDTLKKDKLQHQQHQSPQKPQESADKDPATEAMETPTDQPPTSSDTTQESEASPSPNKDDSVKSEVDPISKEGAENSPSVKEGETVEDPADVSGAPAESTLVKEESGSSEAAPTVEEEKKDEKKKRSGKSFLKKVRSLSFKRAKRDVPEVAPAEPSEQKDVVSSVAPEAEIDTSVQVEEPKSETPKERSTPISLVKKMRSLRITKKSKSEKARTDNDVTNPEVEDDSEKVEEKTSPAKEQPSVEAQVTCEATEGQEEEKGEAPEIKTDQHEVTLPVEEVQPTKVSEVQPEKEDGEITDSTLNETANDIEEETNKEN